MQKMWTEIDAYIDSHLIPEDPILLQTLKNTEDNGFPDHLAVAPNQGMLLQMLIQMNQCKRVLELGTFAAYSTIWLARALPEDGYILTIEGRDTHAALAQENINHAKSFLSANKNDAIKEGAVLLRINVPRGTSCAPTSIVNTEFLGEPAKIITVARIKFIALNLVNKFALIICPIVLEGVFGI